jgi:hypothetical protein
MKWPWSACSHVTSSAHAYVLSGRRAEAEHLIGVQRGYPVREGGIYTALGHKDRAFDALARMMITERHKVALARSARSSQRFGATLALRPFDSG